MQMETIRLYCDVATHRSVSRAAEMHGVTQSAASQRLRAMEKELGVVLIDRSKRPLELTAAGDVYYRGCRKLLESYDRLKEQVTGDGGAETGLRGEVMVAAIYSAGIDLLNQVKADFEATHPRATVSISYVQPSVVYDQVRHGACDLGILSYPQRWPGVASLPLRDEVMAVVTRADHPLSHLESIHASELDGQEMVSFEMSLPIGKHIHRYLREHQVAAPRIVNEFDNIDTIKTYVGETDTVAILPIRTVQREVAAGVLAAVALEPMLVRPLAIVYDKQREMSPLVRAFAEYLVKHQPTPPRAPSGKSTETKKQAALSA